MRLTPLFASLLSTALLAGAALAIPGDASARPSPPNTPKAPAVECWSVTGPHGRGREVYFDAANNCPEPRHCRVWINGQEPPVQVHLESGTKGRIDIGATEPGDKYSYDCVPVSQGM